MADSLSKEIRRRLPLYVLALVLLYCFLAGRTWIVSGDDGTYIAQARSLIQGEYRAVNVPGHPVQMQYPPLFSIYLLPFANVSPGNIGIIRCWVALSALAGVGFLAAAARRRDRELGYVGAALFLVAPLFGEYSTGIMVEPFFLTLCYFTVVSAQKFLDDPKSRGLPWPSILGIIAALWTRSFAVALLAGIVMSFLLRKKYSAALWISVLCLAAISPWLWWQALHHSDYLHSHILQRNIYDPSSGELSFLQVLTYRIPYNAVRYVGRVIPEALFPPFLADVLPWTKLFPLKVLSGLLLTVAIFTGFLRRVRCGGLDAEACYVLATLGMLLIHPVFSDRYLYPVLPALIGYLLLSVSGVKRRRQLVRVLGILFIAGNTVILGSGTSRVDAAYLQSVEWIRENTSSDAQILARKPSTVWFYARRRALSYPATTDGQKWPKNDYVIRDAFDIGVKSAELYADPVVSDTTSYREVFRSPILLEVRVFERTGL